MNLTLHLSPELEARLCQQAQAAGKALEEVAVAVLQQGLATIDEASPLLPPDEWLRQFDAWVSGHESRNPRLDDSRESIYPDRW